jgi:autotransporter-associated beta strand protein
MRGSLLKFEFIAPPLALIATWILLAVNGSAADLLVKEGAGTMTLFVPNTYPFNVQINEGTLALKDAGSLPSGCSVSVALGAVFKISETSPSTSQTIGDLSGQGDVNLGTIALVTGGLGTSTSFGGSFIGSGQITKTGGGVFTLSGDNSMSTSQITVSGGTLSIAANSNIPNGGLQLQGTALQITGSSATISRNIVLLSGGTINIPASCFTNLTGVVSGIGPLNKGSPGELKLSFNNTYSGETIVQDGILSMGVANALPLNGSVTINNSAVLQLNQYSQTIGGLNSASPTAQVNLGTLAANELSIGNDNSDSVYAGTIVGSGKLIKSGTGTAAISGNCSYTGGTVVSQGKLIGNTNSLQGAITNNAILVFDQTFNGTFSGAISGIGTAQKTGSYDLILSPSSFFQSSFSIQNGTVKINGVAGLYASFDISSSATLTGVGQIIGPIYNYGSVIPGNPAGEITVYGQYFQEPGSQFFAYLEPGGLSGRLTVVDSTITILPGNTTLVLQPLPGSYPGSFNYILMSSNVGLTGQFSQIINQLPTFEFNLRYTSNQLICEGTTIPFSDVVKRGNAAAVARCIDAQTLIAGSDFSQVVDLLRLETESNLVSTLNEMQPSLFNGFSLAQQETAVMIHSILQSRIDDLYRRCPPPGVFHAWADGLLYNGRQGSIEEEAGFSFHGSGYSAGIDFAPSQDGLIGLFAAKTNDHILWKEGAGSGTENVWYAGLYGGWHIPYFYVQAASSLAFIGDRGTRNITFECIDESCPERTAYHKNRAIGATGYAEVGSPFEFYFLLRPFVRGDYTFLNRSPFTESGAGSINLNVNRYLADFCRLEGGLELSKCLEFETSRWTIYGKIGSVHEWRWRGAESSASFIDTSCTMHVYGMNPDRSLLSYCAGFNIKAARDHIVISFDFNRLNSEQYQSSYGNLSFSLSF